MRRLFTLITFFALALGGVAGAYQIQQGDTLSSIAKRFDTSVDELIALNDIENANVIYSGDFIETEELLGATPTPTSSAPRVYVESPDWQLFNGAAAADTTLTLDDLEDIYGNEVSMGLSSKMYGRINPDGVTESISFTGITTNGDGTKTLTGVKSVLGQYPYTETSGLTRSHSIGALFRLTNTAGFYNDFGNKENDEIVEGEWLFNQIPLSSTSTPTDQRQLVTLYQFQQATTTGGINGSEGAKGVFEGATAAESRAGTEFGDTGATLVLLAKHATSTGPGGGGIAGYHLVVTDSDGYLSSSFGGKAFGIANLDGNQKVYQNPQSAQVTSTFSKMPITSATTSTLHGSWFGTSTIGSVFYVGSDGYATALIPGTVRQVLRLNSGATAPEWGGATKLSATTTDKTTAAATATSVVSTTIPAGLLGTTNAIRMKAFVSDFDLDTGAVTFELLYDNTVVATATSSASSFANYKGWIEATLFAANSASAQEGVITGHIGAQATSSVNLFGAGTGAENSATALLLDLRVTFDGAGSAKSITVSNSYVELIQ